MMHWVGNKLTPGWSSTGGCWQSIVSLEFSQHLHQLIVCSFCRRRCRWVGRRCVRRSWQLGLGGCWSFYRTASLGAVHSIISDVHLHNNQQLRCQPTSTVGMVQQRLTYQSIYYRPFLGWLNGSDDPTNSVTALKDDGYYYYYYY